MPVPPVFLLPYKPGINFYDYRPTINAAGTRMVFERAFLLKTPKPNSDPYGSPRLFITDLANPKPQLLVPTQHTTARADWCWNAEHPLEDGRIAYSIFVDSNPNGANGVYTAAPQAGGTPQRVGSGDGWIYPTWYPGCRALAVDASTSIGFGTPPYVNTPTATNPGPSTIRVDPNTGAVLQHLSGQSLWAGFPSVNPQRPQMIAFAGQPFTDAGYDQNKNFIYFGNTTAKVPRFRQLEGEGRAPTWSPDGRWLAFESNRGCDNKKFYAIFIQDWMGAHSAAQVTECNYNAQHAKWYRTLVNRRQLLLVSALRYPSSSSSDPGTLQARGIASLDVTAFVTR